MSEANRPRERRPINVRDLAGRSFLAYDRALARIIRHPQFFDIGIIVATVLPIVVYFAQNLSGYAGWLVPLAAGLALVSGTHVFSTGYLLFNPKEHIGVERKGLNLLLVPLIMLTANIGILYVADMKWVMFFFLFYAHYAWYHFYRQNIGVFAFSCQLSRGRPMTNFERRSIWSGVAAGVIATYHNASPPPGIIDQKLYPFDISIIDPYFSRVHHVGQLIYALLIPMVAVYVWRNRSTFTPTNLTIYLCSVFFPLPMYIPGIASYIVYVPIAHGLQYLVFILFHAMQRSHARCETPRPVKSSMPRKMLWVGVPIVFALSMILSGHLIWQWSATIQSGEISVLSLLADNEDIVKFAMGLIFGLTMAHYWVDQHLWKFRNKQRRGWLYEAFPFLAAGTRYAVSARPVPVAR